MSTINFIKALNQAASQLIKPVKAMSLRQVVQRVEQGEAEIRGFISYTYIFWFLLLVSVVFALTGFYRIGASYSNDVGVRVGAVNSDEGRGDAVTTQVFGFFTNNNFGCAAECYVELEESRMATGYIAVTSGFSDLVKNDGGPSGRSGISGEFTASPLTVKSQSQVRLERFYPGPAICTGTNCYE